MQQLPGLEGRRVHDWTNTAGPVAVAYEESVEPVTVMIGPTGGGKSQSSARRTLRVALNQHPSPRDGIRKARIVVVTPTYRRAHDTVIPSYLKVIDKSWGKYSGGKGDPVDHIFDMALDIGGKREKIHVEVLFRAVQDASLEEFVRGLETTAWWFPEMDTMQAEDLLSLASNRVGRYPEPIDRPDPEQTSGPAYAGVYGDANAPVIGGWFHRRFYLERGKHPGDRVLFQPDAFHPKAENMHNLRRIRPDYYAHLASTMDDYDVGRLLRCQPGWSRNGKPVYEHYDDVAMVSDHVEADPNLTLIIGADAGNTLNPAAVFRQRDFGGVHRVLDEIAEKHRAMDISEFGKEIRRVKDTRFSHVREAIIYVDPAAGARTATNRNLTFAQVLQAESGITVMPAPSNDPKVRVAAVNQVHKRKGGLIIHSRCLGLREALSGGYRFVKAEGRKGEGWGVKPDKNEHSHVADADQYGTLGIEGLGAAGGGFISPQGPYSDSGAQSILPP